MSQFGHRKTKIVCTIGPATASKERMRRLIEAGMDVARFNFSHGQPETHRRTMRALRQLAGEMGRQVGLLQDLGGPKIRLGQLKEPERRLEIGEEVTLAPAVASDSEVIPVDYPQLSHDLSVGDRILLADGLVELKVEAKEDAGLICAVIVGGVINSRKGVNLPVSRLSVPVFTDKDRRDLTVGLEEGVDFIALSFVRHEEDLAPVRQLLDRLDRPPMLIAKMEKPQAIERFEAILAQVDGIMIARGDLGVEMPLEEVPMIQKRLIGLTRRAGKPVITATQMLRSMVSSPRPTRAEATDVANAILDGTDALMLSEETAVGQYPVEAVRILDRIALVTEKELTALSVLQGPTPDPPSTAEAISRAACLLAEHVHAAAIVASTTSGGTARLVARFRPSCPVVGLTPLEEKARQLTLSWGVIPAPCPPFEDTDQMLALAADWVLKRGLARGGDRLIVTAGVPVGLPGTTNFLKVVELAA